MGALIGTQSPQLSAYVAPLGSMPDAIQDVHLFSLDI